jgi:hypothetical protein
LLNSVRVLSIFFVCILLAGCLRLEDTSGAKAALSSDPRLVGSWVVEEKDKKWDVTITETTREGHTGYIYHSNDPEQDDDEEFWPLKIGENRFLLTEFPEDDCDDCDLVRYEINDEGVGYVYILKFDEAKVFLTKNYPGTQKIFIDDSGKWLEIISVKSLDDEGKAILNAMAQEPTLWGIQGQYKKVDTKQH